MAGGCYSYALRAVKTRLRASGGWTWPTAAEDVSGTTHMPTDTDSQLLRHELAFLAGPLGVARPDADLR